MSEESNELPHALTEGVIFETLKKRGVFGDEMEPIKMPLAYVAIRLPNGEEEVRTVTAHIEESRVTVSNISTLGKIMGIYPYAPHMEEANKILIPHSKK